MLSPHLRKKGPGGFVDGPRFLSSIFPHHHILSHVLWTCRGSTPFLSLLFIMTQLFLLLLSCLFRIYMAFSGTTRPAPSCAFTTAKVATPLLLLVHALYIMSSLGVGAFVLPTSTGISTSRTPMTIQPRARTDLAHKPRSNVVMMPASEPAVPYKAPGTGKKA